MHLNRSYPTGSIIIKQGEYGDEAFQLVLGTVEVSYTSPEGNKAVLAVLRPPHMFGEMAIIDEKPRSATVTALTPVEVLITQKSAFIQHFASEKESMIVPILRTMFERLRTTNQIISNLSTDMAVFTSSDSSQEVDSGVCLSIKPTTEAATAALGSKKYKIPSFPFRIGRKDEMDMLGINDLVLHDTQPFQASPHHLLISLRNHTIELSDRGSRLGSLVNGARIGLTNRSKVVDLKKGDNEVILGDVYSKLRFNFFVE